MISVIIPALNEAAAIGQTLDLVHGGDIIEIIVADGGSRDATRQIAAEKGAVVLDVSPGRALQMNAGDAAAKGTVLNQIMIACFLLGLPLGGLKRLYGRGRAMEGKKLSMDHFWIIAIIMGVVIFMMPCFAKALDPDEILVIANKNASQSKGLALYYMEQRKIPLENLLTLWVTDNEVCTREDYLKKIAEPVRRYLESERGANIRCLVTMYGMPLKISSPPPGGEELTLERLEKEEKELQSSGNFTGSMAARLKKVQEEIREFKIKGDKGASLDSELSLVKVREYPLGFWLPNPFYYPLRETETVVKKNEVTMVCRLDGPDPGTVKRVIDDSIYAEKNGLSGSGYFDARWPNPPDDKNLSGYALNDKLIHLAAEAVGKSNVAVVVDDTERLFQPGDCPDAALYCGWYSLAKYVDAFTWTRGSIGFHVASSECATLKAKSSNVWCKKMLENGIAATVGPVGEPYVQSFPNPAVFFRLLCEGYLTLVESYYVSLPFLSWKMVLVGDPLYCPYKKNRGGKFMGANPREN